jgi:hypothetical protein
MNKYLSLFALCFAVIFSACEEEDELGPMQFKLTGFTDTLVYRGTSVERNVTLYFLGGEEESATIAVSGLPAGTTMQFGNNTLSSGESTISTITSTANADTGSFSITVTASTEKGGVFTRNFQLRVSRPINSAPVIQLLGAQVFPLTLNNTFTDPGFVAGDVEDGDLTGAVQVTGSVNKDSVGNYVLNYSVTDADGATTSVNRTVEVKNTLNYINGSYTVTTTNLNTSLTRTWITSVIASISVNNQGKIFKVSDLFGADAIFTYNPSKDSIFMAPQTFTVTNGLGTLPHTVEGRGKIVVSGSITRITLVYTDAYTDPNTSQPVTLNLKDEYVK